MDDEISYAAITTAVSIPLILLHYEEVDFDNDELRVM